MPGSFVQRIADYSELHGLFPERGETVLVAVSGGGDSVALLAVLSRLADSYGLNIEAAHMNHALRGKESDGDEAFVRSLAAGLGISLSVERLSPGEIEESDGSIETVARDKRLAFLKHIADRKDAKRIATGHTRDDQVETLLQRIIRGTGPSGLSGIMPMRDGKWIRPLLNESRLTIRDWLASESIGYREDSSNTNTAMFRNRIRHKLLPFLRDSFSEGIDTSLVRLSELSRDENEYLDKLADCALESSLILKNRYKLLLDKSKFLEYHNVVQQRALRRALSCLEGNGRSTDRNEIDNVLAGINRNIDGIDITTSVRLGAGNNVIAFVKRTEQYVPLSIDTPGKTELPQGGGVIFADMTNSKNPVDGIMETLVHPDVISRFGPLTASYAKPGERIRPFGMNGTVNIRDLLASTKLPRVMREHVPVVRAGAVPVWVPGLRSAEELRINRGDVPCTATHLRFADGIRWT